MLKLLADMDKLLASDSHFLLGRWLQDSRQWGTSAQEKNLMEYNARNQITLWGPEGQVCTLIGQVIINLRYCFYEVRRIESMLCL